MLTVTPVTAETTVVELARLLHSLGAGLAISNSVYPGRDQPAFIATVDGFDHGGNLIRAVETRTDMVVAISDAIADYVYRLGRAMSSPMLSSDDSAAMRA